MAAAHTDRTHETTSESTSGDVGDSASGGAARDGGLPASRSFTRGDFVAVLLAVAAALLLYARTYSGDGYAFVNYDDPDLVSSRNPAIGKGLADGFLELLDPTARPQFMHAWLPLYYGSLGIDHALGGGAPWVFHLHSAVLHGIGAALVVLLAARLGLPVVAGGLAGVLFAVHPAATENVAWVAGRKDVLAFAWMAASALCYFEGLRRRSAAWHVLGAVLLGVSLTAKGTTLVLPLLLAVHALLLRPSDGTPASSSARRLLPVLPYALVAALLTAVHLSVAAREGTAGASAEVPFGGLLLASLEALARYVRLLVAPFLGQSVEHGVSAHAPHPFLAVLGGAALAGAGFVVLRRASRPVLAAVVLGVLCALAPFNNLFPRTSVLFAERYAHVALLPFVLGVAAFAASDASRRLGAIVLTAGLCVTAWMRIPVWRDASTLWRDAVARSPENALARLQLADALGREGAWRVGAGDVEGGERLRLETEASWRDALRLAGDDLAKLRAAAGLGKHLYTTAPPEGNTTERLEEAAVRLAEAVALCRGEGIRSRDASFLADLLASRGTVLELLEKREDALAAYADAARTDPHAWVALNGLARVYFLAGSPKEAGEALEQSVAAAPDDPDAARERALIRMAGGDPAGAKAELERAIRARPRDADLHLEAGRLDARLLRPVDAEGHFRKVLELRPGDPVATAGLTSSLLDQAQSQASRDDLSAARTAAEKAAEVAPASFAPHQVLGIVARRAGDLDAATKHLRKASEIHRAGLRIREMLASVLVERAVGELDQGNEAGALVLLEEAVAADARAVATPRARIESGVSGWPSAGTATDDRERVARRSALLGLAWLAWGYPDRALPELDVAVAGAVGEDLRRVAVRLLVRARFQTGDADGAVSAAEELPALGVRDPLGSWSGLTDLSYALTERGIGRRAKGDTAGAAADFERALALLDGAAEKGLPASRRLTRRGEIRFAAEEFLEATKEFDAAIEADPRDVEPLLDRAQIWRTHFLLEEDTTYLRAADRDLRQAIEASPGDPRGMAALGETFVLAQKPGEAYPWLQRALLLDPSQRVVRALLADLTVRAGRQHLEKGETEDARTAAKRAVALEADLASPLILLGDVHLRLNERDRAEALYTEAARRFPQDVEARAALARHQYTLGHGLLLAGRKLEAALAFHKALAYDQDKFDVSAAKDRLRGIARSAWEDGTVAIGAKRIEDAAKHFRASVAAEPTREGHAALASCLATLGDHVSAAESYAAAVVLDGAWVPARLGRAESLLLLGRWEEAAADFSFVRTADGATPEERAVAERQLTWIRDQEAELRKRAGPGEKAPAKDGE